MTSPTSEDLENFFSYHPPSPDQIPSYEQIRAAGYGMAETVLDLVPEGRERSTAIAKIREAVMWANAGIACAAPGEVRIVEEPVLPEGTCDDPEPHSGHEDERDGLRFWCTGNQPATLDRPEDRDPDDPFATDFGDDPNGDSDE